MKRREENVTERIRDMVNSLGWDDLVEKTQIIMVNAQNNLNNATKETFDKHKGFFDCAKLFNRLIVEDPRTIAEKGMVKVKGG